MSPVNTTLRAKNRGHGPSCLSGGQERATLKKVDEMASDWEEKAESAMHKLKEFADLGYPAQERVRACRVLARERDWQVWMMAATLQKHM